MKKNMTISLLSVFITLSSQAANAAYFKDFSTKVTKNLVTDYGVDNYDNKDDSPLLQKAINKLSKHGGGEIIIPKGVYYFTNIQLKSNIKILIDPQASIRPYINNIAENGLKSIFSLGLKSAPVENVVITSSDKDKRFTVQLPTIREKTGKSPKKPFNNVYGVRVFQLVNVKNFKISNMNVFDSKTKFSAITMGPIVRGKYKGAQPADGEVSNISAFNSAYGYGAIQVQAGDNISFENIISEGGATLRLETGYSVMNDLQIGSVSNIKADNISCIDGSAALTLSPHSMQENKNIDAQNIKSNDCNFAVRIAAGYISTKQKNKSLTPGVFTNVKIHDVDATFGFRSQILHKDFTLLPKDLQRYIYRTDTELEALRGPSIAAVGYVAGPGEKQNYDVSVTGIKAHGFNTKAITTSNDRYKLYTKEH